MELEQEVLAWAACSMLPSFPAFLCSLLYCVVWDLICVLRRRCFHIRCFKLEEEVPGGNGELDKSVVFLF